MTFALEPMDTPLTLHNTTRNQPVCGTVHAAVSYWSRLRGLLCRPEPQAGSGLLLLPSRGIHTFFMWYPIDVVFLDRELRVLRLCEAVAPWRVRLPGAHTHCVLELRTHEAGRRGLAVGDLLQLQHDGHALSLSQLQGTAQRRGQTPGARALLFVLAFMLLVQAALCWSARKPALAGHVDLRAYYAAGTAARVQGLQGLYSSVVEQNTQQQIFHDGWRTLHFLYPPFAVLPYRALAAMPYRSVFFLVVVGNLVCLYLSAGLFTRIHRGLSLSPAVLTLCALAAFPCTIALMQGQISCVLLLLLTLFYALHHRGWPLLAGLCLAAALVKVQVALPIALLFLLWRRYRVLAGFLAGAAVLTTVSASLVGVTGLQAYCSRLSGMGATMLHSQAAAYAQYGMQTAAEPTLHGLAVLLTGGGAQSAWFTLAMSAALLVWCARQRVSVGTAVCAATLLSYHMQPYDLLLLLLPLALAVAALLEGDAANRSVAHLRRSPTAWLVAGSALLLSAPVAAFLMLHGATTWYLLASIALLAASTRQGNHAQSHASSAVLLQGDGHLPLMAGAAF